MVFLENITQLIEYRERLFRQCEVLRLSTIFLKEEKSEMLSIYANAVSICDNRIKAINENKI